MFNRKNDETPITREEAVAALAGYVTREDAEQYASALSALDDRVSTLERLARELRANGAYDGTTGSRAASNVATQEVPAPTTGVDYGAIAFGLSQVKNDVAKVMSSGADTRQIQAHYRETVQYFADVLAKSDPQFDAAAFRIAAGA